MGPSTTREPVVGPFLREILVVDRARARPWSALRRTAVILAVMAASWHAVGPQAATSAGMAAMLVGFLDRQQSPRQVVRIMLAGTLALAGTHLVADSLVGWPVAVLAILVAIAFVEGMSIAVHHEAPIVAHFCGTVAATAAVSGPATGHPVASAVAVLIAGAAQTGATLVSARLAPRVREVTVVADEVDLIAESLAVLAAEPDPRHPGTAATAALDTAARHMTNTTRALARSDLTAPLVDYLGLILWAADQARVEARAVAATRAAGTDRHDVDAADLRVQLLGTAATLARGARVLRLRGPAREQAVADLLDTPETGWLSAPHVSAAQADFEAGVAQVVREQPHRVGRAPGTGLSVRDRIAAALAPRSLSLRLGARIAVAALAAMLAAAWLGLSHASWASTSVLSVFRPDGGAALPRIALRSIAVTVAAVVVVGVAVAASGERAWLLAAMGVAILLGYWLGPANYGIFGFTVTVAVLMILAATGADPVEIAVARWLDTLVGCAVAVVVAFALPVWSIGTLPGTLAGAGRALAAWLGTLGEAAVLDPAARDPRAARAAGNLVRDAVSDTLATFRVARMEPHGTIPVTRLRLVLAHLRACAQASLTAENLLVRAAPADPDAAELAQRAAGQVEAVAQAVLHLETQAQEVVAGTPGQVSLQDRGPSTGSELSVALGAAGAHAREAARVAGLRA